MAETAYVLCALTSLACAIMLARGYWRSRTRFLLWSALCFTWLAINNLLLFADKVVFPEVDGLAGVSFLLLRSGAALAGMSVMLFGLIWDAE